MIAPWRSVLARALHYHREPHARYVQLATVSPRGLPHNRTIVFRGFLRDTDKLQFITDGRSPKVADIRSTPYGEVCWYFPKTREQFRLAGKLDLIDHDHPDRQSLWQQLSPKSRAQFFWAEPGAPRSQEDFLAESHDQSPPANFYLLLLDPTRLDHLNLRGTPQDRTLYNYSGGSWQISAVNP